MLCAAVHQWLDQVSRSMQQWTWLVGKLIHIARLTSYPIDWNTVVSDIPTTIENIVEIVTRCLEQCYIKKGETK